MPRIIFKCPYIKGRAVNGPRQRGDYVRYIATRDGAQQITPKQAHKPVTKKQREMVLQLLRDYPDSKNSYEYEDYMAAPTMGNASEFITRTLEDNFDQAIAKEKYVSYIASRPRAQRVGRHALFTNSDEVLSLDAVADSIAAHTGNVWLPIISMRREDATRLGYDNTQNWQIFLTGFTIDMAKAMKIPPEQFRWYAAFHDEGHHPHIHMVCYSADGHSGFLTKDGIAKIKSGMAREIFRNELLEIYEQQTVKREELLKEVSAVIQEMQNGTLENPRIDELMGELSERLSHISGKKQYGYLKAPLKNMVDEIVDELEKDERISRAYDLWYKLRDEVLHTYKDSLPDHIPISQQKEFKRVRNMVIEQAMLWRLQIQENDGTDIKPDALEEIQKDLVLEVETHIGAKQKNDDLTETYTLDKEYKISSSAADIQQPIIPITCATRLLYHMSKIFADNTQKFQPNTITFVDKKMREKLKRKKVALGYKADDHEDDVKYTMPSSMTL